MKLRLTASIAPILIFVVFLFLPLGPASALPYAEDQNPFFVHGMTMDFNQTHEWQLPSWGEHSFTATDPGMFDSSIIGALTYRWPAIWNHITFGDTMAAFLNFLPETFRRPELLENLPWLHFDQTGSDSPTPVPEPATLLLLGAGLFGFAGIFRKQSKW